MNGRFTPQSAPVSAAPAPSTVASEAVPRRLPAAPLASAFVSIGGEPAHERRRRNGADACAMWRMQTSLLSRPGSGDPRAIGWLMPHPLEDVPRIFPVQYSADEARDLAHCRWALQFLAPSGLTGAVELLTRLSHGINQSLLYRRREAKGFCGADDRVGARMAPPWQESPKRVRPPADTPADQSDRPLWAFGGCQTWGFTSTAAGPSDAGSSRPSSETGIYPDAKPNRFAMGRSSS